MKVKSLFAVTAAALALGLGLAACGEDDDEESASTGTTTTEEQAPEQTGPADETVKLGESEYKIDPADVSVKKAGTVEFLVKNTGSVTHGGTAALTVQLEKGVYELYCPIDDHKERGMTGELRVAGATGSAEDSGGEDDSSEDTSSGDDSRY